MEITDRFCSRFSKLDDSFTLISSVVFTRLLLGPRYLFHHLLSHISFPSQLANSARTIPVRISTGISVSLASRDLSPEAPEFKVTAVSLAKSTLSKPTTEMISASRAKMEDSRTIRSAAPCVFPSNSVLTDFISMIL